MRIRVRGSVWSVTVALAVACSSSHSPEGDGASPGVAVPRETAGGGGAPPALATPTAPASPAHSPPPAAMDPAREPGCRVSSLVGSASRNGVALRTGEKLRTPAAIELEQGATLRLVHTVSARQWTVTGPARFVACDAGAEEIAIAHGALRIEPSTGVRPGAEVWLGTPFGSLRYADARAEVDVAAQALEVRVASGQLWFAPLAGESAKERVVDPTSPARGGARKGSARFAAEPHRPSETLALARCARDAEQAEQRARALLAGSSEPLGVRAAAHVRARQQAHASCVSAWANLLAAETEMGGGAAPAAAPGNGAPATRASGDGLAREGASARWTELARYDQMWRRVPEPAHPAPGN